MNILAIETSCDETSVAVVTDGSTVLSLSIASSQEMHAQTGGIIPERAARKQVEYLIPTLEKSLATAFPEIDKKHKKTYFDKIDAIAVTIGPGLIGSLLVGVEAAKALAYFYKKPLIPVNHIEAHLYANWIGKTTPLPFPCLGLVVSGGHTDFVLLKNHDDIHWIAGTRDDAAGECFDKCARLLGLGYPGGPAIAKAAEMYMTTNDSPLTYFPRAMAHDKTLDVSFSGLKTALSREVTNNQKKDTNMLAAEIQEAIIDTLINKLMLAIRANNIKSVIISGGVTANLRFRKKFTETLARSTPQLQAYMPDLSYCTDNAAMIATRAFFHPIEVPLHEVSANPELHF